MRIDPGFEQMYRAEYGSVFRAVYLLCGDRAMAEDATQEAFARALERWRRIEGRSWATGWVVTTALNITRRALRRRPVPVSAGNPSTDPDELLDLRRAVRALPPRQQEAVFLHYLQDLPIEDVARAMGQRREQ
jgi:RNA polymerase sigma-70 factor (ECF subfamily)